MTGHHQIFVSPENIRERLFVIEGAEAHHLVHVLRKKIGDEIYVFDGRGLQALAQITSVAPHPARVEGFFLKEEHVQGPAIKINLVQGLPRGSKFDFVLEKATELGVHAVLPFLSQKNPIKLTPAQSESKLRRWNAVAKAAAMQCGRSDIPRIEAPRSLLEWGDRFSSGPTILFWENETQNSVAEVIAQKPPAGSTVHVIVGPESGFELLEVQALIKLGAKPASLGKRILRTETAGLVVLSILNHTWNLF